MWHDLFPLHFTDDELFRLNELEGKVLSRATYVIWKNLTQKGDDFQALDWVKLDFEDGDQVVFTAGEESDGLRVTALDLGLEQTRIQQQFGGQVALEETDVSTGSVWGSAIGKKLTSVGLLEGPDKKVQNNQLQLDFEGKVIRFELNAEGMVVR